jgi:hypothetical protein
MPVPLYKNKTPPRGILVPAAFFDRNRTMKKTLLIALGVVLGIVAVSLWHSYRTPPPAPVAERQPVPEPAETRIRPPIAEAGSEVGEAVPGVDLQKPLPGLGESDERMREFLPRLFAGQHLDTFFVLDNFIQRLVVMVDNLPRRDLPVNRLPTRPVPGKFQVTAEETNPAFDPANFRRYTPYIRLAEAVDPKQAVAVYVRFYPLFQEAYEGIGYPSGYFNDRLIEVIDHLLATPEVPGPIHLVRPKIYYLYADPDLEALSAGRKLLIRTGPDNAARIKEILRAYRRELAAASQRR